MQVLASDGHAESAPVTYASFDFLKQKAAALRAFLANRKLKLFNGYADAGLLSSAQLADARVGAEIASLGGRTVYASYKIDDANSFSTPAAYSVGEQNIFVFGDETEPYLQPGPHTIVFRFEDQAGGVTEQELRCAVNSAPKLRLTSDQPLAFDGVPTSSVPLPISVEDAESEQVVVFYRFEGDDVWAQVPTANEGGHCMPASEFSDHLEDGASGGAIELFAWDGLQKSGSPPTIEYSITGGAQPEDDSEPEEEEPAVEYEALSPAAIVALVLGGIAMITLAVAIGIFATRRPNS